MPKYLRAYSPAFPNSSLSMEINSTSNKRLWLTSALAVASFVPTLFFYYVGEEAIFPISSMEMWHTQQWTRQLLYGLDVQHPPFYNWLIMPLANLFGWAHVLEVARAITVSATLLSTVVLAWFARRLFHDDQFALLAAVIYLTLADVLLYRGWLAYVDPLFALFVFASMAALMVAAREQSTRWLLLAVLALTLAFMSKALTAYVFYGTAWFVLLWNREQRKFLLGAPALLIHVAALAIPFVWFVLAGNPGQGTRMFGEILAKLTAGGLLPYLEQVALFPLETLLRLSPALPLAIYFLSRKRQRLWLPETEPLIFKTLVVTTLLCYLPYWLSPRSSIRYILPLCPLFALLAARLIWRAGEAATKLSERWLWGMIALKFVVVLAVFPYYQREFRGENYLLAAKDIISRSAGHALYVTDVSASGLSVAAYIDSLRHPLPPLQWVPTQWDSGFVIAYTLDPALGQLSHKYQLGGNELYLLCRGSACK